MDVTVKHVGPNRRVQVSASVPMTEENFHRSFVMDVKRTNFSDEVSIRLHHFDKTTEIVMTPFEVEMLDKLVKRFREEERESRNKTQSRHNEELLQNAR